MSNLSKRQRVGPSTAPPSTKAKQNGRRPLTVEQKKMQLELLHYWELQVSLGVDLNAERMSLQVGWSKTVATLYLKGHIPLNTDACLLFAREMKTAPQIIWPDWKWADLTGDPAGLNLARLFSKLEIGTRLAVNTILRLNGTLQHDGTSNVIRILPGRAR